MSCGNKINEKVTLDLIVAPTCKYCGNPVALPDDINKFQHSRFVAATQQTVAKKDFSVGIFIALLLFFWPGAIYYVVTRRSKAIAESPVFQSLHFDRTG